MGRVGWIGLLNANLIASHSPGGIAVNHFKVKILIQKEHHHHRAAVVVVAGRVAAQECGALLLEEWAE